MQYGCEMRIIYARQCHTLSDPNEAMYHKDPVIFACENNTQG